MDRLIGIFGKHQQNSNDIRSLIPPDFSIHTHEDLLQAKNAMSLSTSLSKLE
jgi:hypothetical protein